MKHILYIIGTAILLTCLNSCEGPDLQTKVIDENFSTALAEGSKDSLLIEFNLEWPVKGLPTVSMQNIQRELSAAIFGKEATEGSIGELIDEYVAKQGMAYRQNVNELKGIFSQDNEDWGIYSWNEEIKGSFVEPVGHMQSYILYAYEYSGGAHGMDIEKGFTFDLSSGKRITEADLFVREYKPELAELLTERLPKSVSKEEYDMLFLKTIEPNGNFYVDTDGVTYIFERYEIGPYASGNIRISVPWDKLKRILK